MAAPGTVYVFNTITQLVRLSINNPSSPGVKIFANSKSSSPPYAPPSVQIARTDVPGTMDIFTNGKPNTVIIETQNGQSDPAIINIPADGASTDAIWLYLFFNELVLFDTRGAMLDQVAVSWSTQVSMDMKETGFAIEEEEKFLPE